MPEDSKKSFAVQTTENLMNLTELMGNLKTMRTQVEALETLTEGTAMLLDAYEGANDRLLHMLVTANEHILHQDEMLESIFARVRDLPKK